MSHSDVVCEMKVGSATIEAALDYFLMTLLCKICHGNGASNGKWNIMLMKKRNIPVSCVFDT